MQVHMCMYLLCVNTCKVSGLQTLAQGQSRKEEEVGHKEAHLFSLAPWTHPIPGTDIWGSRILIPGAQPSGLEPF